MSLHLFVFHLDISGKDFSRVQLSNIPLIDITLDKSHFEISGNDSNKQQFLNK